MVDANTKATAEKIAADLIWRLEILQHRCRYNISTGEYRQLPTRVRRFSNACPTDIIAEVIDAIVRQAPYSKIVFNGENDSDLKYRPTMTSIRKDDSLKATEGSKGTYTIIQDLILDGEPDTYATGELSSCSQRVTATHYWDEVDIIDCPTGGQGVTYQIADVSRDKETDLFSYKLRRSDAITQHNPETVSECNDGLTKTVETWDNVYTDDTGAARVYKKDSIVHSGETITIPAPCDDATTGTLIAVKVDENDDCTLKIEITRTTSRLEACAEYLRYKDQFLQKTSDLARNAQPVATDKNGVDYDPVNGTKTTIEVKNNDDGTVDKRVTVEKDLAVAEAEKGEAITPRYVEVTWTDKNQTSPASALPAGYSYGSWKCVKTAVGRYDNTFTGHRLVTDVLGYQCNDTAFLHTHSDSQTIPAYPTPDECVPVATGGVVKSYDIHKDEHGVITKTTQVKTEHPFSTFRKTVAMTLLGKTVRVYSKSQGSPESEPSEGTVGTTEFQITDGRLYDTVKETFVLNSGVISLASDCAKTVFEHKDASEVTVPEFGTCTEDAGGGFYRTVKYSKDVNTGAIRRHTETSEELAFPSATVSKRVTPKFTSVQTVNRNVRGITASGLSGSTLAVGVTEQRDTNPGGSVNQSTTTITPNADAALAAKCGLTALRHEHETESVLPAGASVVAGSSLSVGGGESKTEQVTVDDNNVKTKSLKTVKEFDRVYGSRVHEDAMQAHQVVEETSAEKNPGDVSGEGDPFTATESVAEKGTATDLADSLASPFNVTGNSGRLGSGSVHGYIEEAFSGGKLVTGGGFKRGIQFVADSEVTDGGNFHTKKYKYVPKPQKWLDTAIADGAGGHYTWNFRNLTQAQVKELMADVCNVAAGGSNGTGSLFGSFNNHPFVRRTLNDFGLYDGSCGFESRNVTWTSSGSSKIKEVAAYVLAQWKEKSIQIKPVSQLDPYAGDYAAGGKSLFYIQTTTATYKMVAGVGKASLAAYCALGDFWASPSVQINPSTEAYTCTACVNQETKIELKQGDNLPDSAQSVTLMDNAAE